MAKRYALAGQFLWLIPLPYMLFGIVAALVFPRIEYAYFPSLGNVVSVGSAQAYLSAIGSGTITLTALVFSVMFVMMQMAMGSYSKRLVMLFGGNPIGLHALGVFSATFMYALGVLQFVDRDRSGKVPWLSTEFATVLLVLSMVFVALLVRRGALLRITYILQYVGDKGRAVIAATLPQLGDRERDQESAALWQRFEALRTQSCVQRVTYDGVPLAIADFRIDDLVQLARASRCTIVMNCAVGDTVACGTVLLEVYGEAPVAESALLKGVVLSPQRTFEQDPKYPIRLLVDTAIMALSPAVNDPTTAVQAIDQIQDLIHRLGHRVLDAGFAKDADGELRLVFPMATWEEYLSLAFDEIRFYGTDAIQVLRRLRAALIDLSRSVSEPSRVVAVNDYLKHLDAAIERSNLDPADRLLALEADPQGLGHTRAGT